ncbi:unnamed protein product [Candidula unifasciata]|uniref:Protein sleepless n=1 Tax=Candidula unifasciata TaxID=100452 RepID=A0A8S3Z5S5_9EUPU|nr:unnamed protein product [Candidula unifasciata]
MRHRGIANTCLAPRNMSNCMGCMKTVTKVKIRDSGYMTGWERMSVVVSRYCMRNGSTNRRPSGCYKQQNNGGYTERCFCYTDHCNSGASRSTYGLLPAFLSSSSLLTICILSTSVVFFNINNGGRIFTLVVI